MAPAHKFGQPVEDGSGLRVMRRWRLLLAHDASASTCDSLIDAIDSALVNVDLNESSSVDDARVALHTAYEGGTGHDGRPKLRAPKEPHRFHLCMVCLDLPPAPLGGVRLAQECLREGLPVILVTRSLRWVPASATALRALPWIQPDASAAEVSRAVGEAMATLAAPHDEGARLSWVEGDRSAF